MTAYSFTNQRDAVQFAKAQGGPIEIDIEHVARGQWVVTVTRKIVAGDRVRLIGTNRTGTAKRVDPHEVRVIWDERSRQHPGITATWTRTDRLEVAPEPERTSEQADALARVLGDSTTVRAQQQRPVPCPRCEALPGDNDHCIWDGTPHTWHVCGDHLRTHFVDSNCPTAVEEVAR